MKNYVFFLALILLSICTSCRNIGKLANEQKSRSYFIDSKGKVSYCMNGNWFSLGISPMPEADAQSFEVLAEDIARDKNAVYFCAIKQKQVDRNSFYVDKKIPKDRFHVYYILQHYGFKIIEGADPKTYELIDNHPNWARDRSHYFYSDKLVHADRKTFAFINSFFMKDKDSVYTTPNTGGFKSILPNSGNAEAVNDYYMRFGNTIYYPSFQQGSDGTTRSFDSIHAIRVINEQTICVNNKDILILGKNFKYAEVDAPSFQLLTFDGDQDDAYMFSYYSKDKNHVYYDQEVIPGADVKTFILIGRDFGKDDKNAYFQNKLLKGVDATSFKKEGNYYKDKLGNKFSALTGNKV
ncbi:MULTISPECIES: DKNYY domain-containing protein [Chryseobacterium]|uniref:DKNYY family protein n=1 Tax=Chryseobacterium camelliae TaxID=1265445 RepID=A0ABU0TIM2_9FLAO|nr:MULTISPECIES: DKNYY domain-containing protein [Chryseobacterium]MDT3409231.1 hypothetical protein [Pseudacidovorax intermedius]MDQ1096907.1 hypothetical protein [Chryseobacterium camelliae]MDQ1100849.1 hypothetical protein [Chryseobacterium sp. SORGH_AS_1048]MDR6084291.1 hypothetical protein [Chryseobacterium sp. SORGH_AS_0909]MDR6132562.1 hypothetical protein [Chryseobacterium sp. SORGH_AS_1175]